MMNRFFHHIKQFFNQPDIELVAAYQHKLPHDVTVFTSFDKKTGTYTARIVKIDSKDVKDLIITESQSSKDLVININDMMLTYLDIPEDIKSSMPMLLPEDIDYADQVLQKHGNLVLAK